MAWKVAWTYGLEIEGGSGLNDLAYGFQTLGDRLAWGIVENRTPKD